MLLRTKLFGTTYEFGSIKELLAKANEEKSGDRQAGIAAGGLGLPGHCTAATWGPPAARNQRRMTARSSGVMAVTLAGGMASVSPAWT